MKTSENISEISKALAKAQGAIQPAKKDNENGFTKSKYADIASVRESIRSHLCENGLSVWQDVTTNESNVSVHTRLTHISGEWVEFGPLNMPIAKKDAHGIGSAITYGRRYALCSALCLVSEDDDGNEATKQVDESKFKQKKENIPTRKPIVEFSQLPEVFINEEQLNKISILINEASDEKKKAFSSYLEHLKAKDLTQIPRDKFEACVFGLTGKKPETQITMEYINA